MSNQSITLVQFPRHLGIPNASPFCAKLELWLKLAEIPFEIEEQVMPNSAPKKKIPWIIDQGINIGDSTLIIEHLTKTRGIKLDDGLSAKQRGGDQALVALLEERLYWQLVCDRWIGGGWPGISAAFFSSMPAIIQPVMRAYAKRMVRRQLWTQGTARHSLDEIYAMAARDLTALSDIVGDGPYVHGDQIRSIDCAVWGTLISLIQADLDTPMTQAARSHGNLVAYADRITQKYFPDFAK